MGKAGKSAEKGAKPNREIERRFLVDLNQIPKKVFKHAGEAIDIEQGYYRDDEQRGAKQRIRQQTDVETNDVEWTQTQKHRTGASRLERIEDEIELDYEEAAIQWDRTYGW